MTRVQLATARSSEALAPFPVSPAIGDGLAGAIRALCGTTTVDQLFNLVPRVLCQCGFTRAWLAAVDDTEIALVGAHDARRAITFDRTPRRLDPGSNEAEAVRRRRPLLISNDGARVAAAIAASFNLDVYLAAPVVVDTRVIAIVGADRDGTKRPADHSDRQIALIFAEALTHVFQRVLLQQKLEELRTEVRRSSDLLNESITAQCCGSLKLPTGIARASDRRPPIQVSGTASGTAKLSALVTPRELEILRLIAGGETTAGIARELVISEGTVKSHVKNIFRKLRVSNRAQAISRFFMIAGPTP